MTLPASQSHGRVLLVLSIFCLRTVEFLTADPENGRFSDLICWLCLVTLAIVVRKPWTKTSAQVQNVTLPRLHLCIVAGGLVLSSMCAREGRDNAGWIWVRLVTTQSLQY